MASNSILEQLKEETSESKLVGLLREVLQANTNEAKTALLARLNTIGKEPSASCKVNREIENFTFTEPELTLDEWISKIRRREPYPQQPIHYKVENWVPYGNSNENSYIRNEDSWAKSARTNLQRRNLAQNKQTTDQELDKIELETRIETYIWNSNAFNENPVWRVLKRSALGDTKAEDTCIRYIKRPSRNDDGQIDWFSSIKQLAKLGTDLGYTLKHYKTAIDRWTSFFAPNLRNMTEPMEAVKAAQFLMKMTAPENTYDRLTHELYTLIRRAGTPLMVIMTQLHELASARAVEMNIENAEEETERLMYIGFEKFTTGAVRQEFLEAYEYRKREAKGQPKWNRMLELLVERERRLGMPVIDLKFCERGSPLEGASAYNIKTFNVDTRIINRQIQNYKPETPHINRKDQYLTLEETE